MTFYFHFLRSEKYHDLISTFERTFYFIGYKIHSWYFCSFSIWKNTISVFLFSVISKRNVLFFYLVFLVDSDSSYLFIGIYWLISLINFRLPFVIQCLVSLVQMETWTFCYCVMKLWVLFRYFILEGQLLQ